LSAPVIAPTTDSGPARSSGVRRTPSRSGPALRLVTLADGRAPARRHLTTVPFVLGPRRATTLLAFFLPGQPAAPPSLRALLPVPCLRLRSPPHLYTHSQLPPSQRSPWVTKAVRGSGHRSPVAARGRPGTCEGLRATDAWAAPSLPPRWPAEPSPAALAPVPGRPA